MRRISIAVLGAATCLLVATADGAKTVSLSGADKDKLDVGFFPGGTKLFISAGGTVMIAWNFYTRPDGSLAAPMPADEPYYTSAVPGATNYPAVAGGDGINHFPGGGMNYSTAVAGLNWPIAGKFTTDTRDPAAIRFGAAIGTFADNPVRADWFLVGFGTTVVVPQGGCHLYLLVNETWWGDNSGAYRVTISDRPSLPADSTTAHPIVLPVRNPSDANPPPIFSGNPGTISLPNDKAFGYTLPAGIGLTHRIEASPDLFHWEELTNSILYFKDPDSTNFSERFYRFPAR